ncbi:hypothetical protein, partial [Nitrincola lacisaponensis]|uniref:hypothetical protein n=1 Tax=Nitrincola lacisaponensis TaxID=267850 RepID=UPI00195533DD
EHNRFLPQYHASTDPILHKICAQPVPVDDPEVQFMIHRAETEQQHHLQRSFQAFERYYEHRQRDIPRCLSEKGASR